jgi:hypothetical protein
MSSGDLWTQNINQWTDKVWGYCLYFLPCGTGGGRGVVLDLKILDETHLLLGQKRKGIHNLTMEFLAKTLSGQ